MPEPVPALDPKSSRARILELEYQLAATRNALAGANHKLERLRDYADTFDDKHDGKMPKAGVVAILDEDGGFTLTSTITGRIKYFS